MSPLLTLLVSMSLSLRVVMPSAPLLSFPWPVRAQARAMAPEMVQTMAEATKAPEMDLEMVLAMVRALATMETTVVQAMEMVRPSSPLS